MNARPQAASTPNPTELPTPFPPRSGNPTQRGRGPPPGGPRPGGVAGTQRKLMKVGDPQIVRSVTAPAERPASTTLSPPA